MLLSLKTNLTMTLNLKKDNKKLCLVLCYNIIKLFTALKLSGTSVVSN